MARVGNDCLHPLNSYLYPPEQESFSKAGKDSFSNLNNDMPMALHKFQFEFEVLDSSDDLNEEDKALVASARACTASAYAPYSHFHVAAVARMANGEIVSATNQENASYPVGICAERVLLGILSSSHPKMHIDTMAVSYYNHGEGKNEEPISPCGLCRQSLLEYQYRVGFPIRFILAGQTGRVLIIKNAKDLLPFAFDADYLKP